MNDKMASVTQILHWFHDFTRITAEVLENAAARGTQVHRLCEAIVRGLWVADVPEHCQGYVESFGLWFEAAVAQVVEIEPELRDDRLGLVGHPDYLLTLKGDKALGIWDLKTPVTHQKTWRLQLGGYFHLASVMGLAIGRVGTVMLSPQGKAPSVREYTQTMHQDRQVFLSAYNLFNFFQGGRV